MAKKSDTPPDDGMDSGGIETPEQIFKRLGFPPLRIKGQINPGFFQHGYQYIVASGMKAASEQRSIPFNSESLEGMLDSMAKSNFLDPKKLHDHRTDGQRLADAMERLCEIPREVWEQIDDEADALISMMDKVDKGAFEYIGKKAQESDIPKLVRGVLMKVRTLRQRARQTFNQKMLDTACKTLPLQKPVDDWRCRAALEAAWPLRLMLYCGRSNLPHLANAAPEESIYSMANHHFKIACDVWHARKGIRYGKPVDGSSSLSRANWNEVDFNGCIVVCAPGHGKPLHVDTPVTMGNGTYKRLGDIRIGDSVISHAGIPRKVTEIFEQGNLPSLRIATASGRSVVSALEHPFLTPDGYKRADELRVGEVLAIPSRVRTVPTASISEDEARLIGYMIGDGNSTIATKKHLFSKDVFHARFTNADDSVLERLTSAAQAMGFRVVQTPSRSEATDIRFTTGTKNPQQWMVSTGLAGKDSYSKRVPESIFASSDLVVAEYLAAHFETDGTVGTKGAARSDCCIELYSVSADLLMDAQRLLTRFGIYSRMQPKRGRYKGHVHNSWRLTISERHNVYRFQQSIPIRGPKRQRLEEWANRAMRFDGPFLSDAIVTIDRVADSPCRCLTVEHDHTFLANDLVVHNTEIGRFIVASMIVENNYHQVMLNHAVGDKAMENLAYLASLFKRDSEVGRRFGSLFPELTLAQISSKKFRLKLANDTKSPTANAAGVSSRVSGSNASIQWWDDPVDQEETVSETERKQAFETLNGTWLTRLRRGGFLLVTATLWHKADAISRFIEGAKASGYKKSIQRCGGPKSSPPFAPIWPDMYPASFLRSKYATMRNPGLYSAAYMANPVAEEKRIVRKLRLYDPSTEEHARFVSSSAKYLSLDPAATRGERSDHAGALYFGFGTVAVEKMVNGRKLSATEHRIRILAADSIPSTQAELVAHTVELTKTRTIDYVMVECRSGYVGTAEMFENYHGIDVIRLDPRSRGKEERLRAAAPALEDSNADLGVRAVVEIPGVWKDDGTMGIDPRFTQLAEEILDFGVCATDNLVDATTQAIIYLSPDLGIGTGGIVNRMVAKSQLRSGPSQWLNEQLERAEKGPPKLNGEDDIAVWTRTNWNMPPLELPQ